MINDIILLKQGEIVLKGLNRGKEYPPRTNPAARSSRSS